MVPLLLILSMAPLEPFMAGTYGSITSNVHLPVATAPIVPMVTLRSNGSIVTIDIYGTI